MASRALYVAYSLFGTASVASGVSVGVTTSPLASAALILGGILALIGGVVGWRRGEGGPEPGNYTPTDYAAFVGTGLYAVGMILSVLS